MSFDHLVGLTSDVIFCLVDIQRGNVLVRLLARGDGNVGNQRQDEESVPWLIGAVEDETCAWTGHLQRGETGGGGEGGEGLRGLVAGRGVVLRGRRLNVSALVLETGESAFTWLQLQPYLGLTLCS